MMTHADLVRELQAIKAALFSRLLIVRDVIDMHGQTIATYRRTIVLPSVPRISETHSLRRIP